MRLNRLDLTRYGKFTGKSISFGEKVAGKTDLHLIYGLNEAGKSTLFSAIWTCSSASVRRAPTTSSIPMQR